MLHAFCGHFMNGECQIAKSKQGHMYEAHQCSPSRFLTIFKLDNKHIRLLPLSLLTTRYFSAIVHTMDNVEVWFKILHKGNQREPIINIHTILLICVLLYCFHDILLILYKIVIIVLTRNISGAVVSHNARHARCGWQKIPRKWMIVMECLSGDVYIYLVHT